MEFKSSCYWNVTEIELSCICPNISCKLNDQQVSDGDNIQAVTFVKQFILLYVLPYLSSVQVRREDGILKVKRFDVL